MRRSAEAQGALSKEREVDYEKRLDGLLPGLPWQARNQARMHVWKGLPPHLSTADAMTCWLEPYLSAIAETTLSDKERNSSEVGHT